ncbi:MAG TPA: GNAT family N-acetyltransferase [Polyangia bacterium]|nr:GNAT family N-acetyltransferase [Polyangia bacterium]
MTKARPWAVEWTQGGETLLAIEPGAGELRQVAPALAAFYNDDHNRRMMAHDDEPHTPDDVVAYYEALRAEGGRPFLLYRDGVLMGDADFRNIVGDRGEFAIMIGARSAQGRGLGTRFARMLHAFGFGTLGLGRIYVSVIPANTASRRLFERLGYRIDDSPEARALIDEPSDVTLSLPRAAFDEARTDDQAAIRAFERPASA